MQTTTANMASSNGRFVLMEQEEVEDIIGGIESKNTKSATKRSVKAFRDYLEHQETIERDWYQNLGKDLETGRQVHPGTKFEEYSDADLDIALEKFYMEVRKEKEQELYKMTSFYALRYGINRHLNSYRIEKNLPAKSILSPEHYPRSNNSFKAMTKKIKKEGKGGIESYPPIEEGDRQKISEYFEDNIRDDPVVLQEKVR